MQSPFINAIKQDISILKKVIVAFIPTAAIGFLLYPVIKNIFFNNTQLQLIVFAAVGILFIAFEYIRKSPLTKSITAITYKEAALVGVIQALAIVPGVSRAGAVIIALMVLSYKREDAARFSFFLAVPTILSASLFDLAKSNHAIQTGGDAIALALGFVVAFITALLVVRLLMKYLTHHSISAFGWYRLIAVTIVCGMLLFAPKNKETTGLPSTPIEQESPEPVPKQSLIHPTTEFRQRVTKKPFGIYIAPSNSPVQPEKFTGYHTGIDVEYSDVSEDVPVTAIADGTVLFSKWASGYGGVIAIIHTINNEKVTAIYGHIKQTSLPAAGKKVSAGEEIGILGESGSRDTDGERKHLHLGIVKGSTPNIKGYVQTQAELAAWVDPLTLFP